MEAVNMASEDEWAAERQRFVADNTASDGGGTNAPAMDPSGQQPAEYGEESLLGTQFAQLARLLFAAETTEQMLQRIVSAAGHIVPGADLVSLTWQSRDGLTTPVATEELAERLDSLQYTHHEGPCVSATVEGGSGQAASPDLTNDPQWPAWSPAAVAEGAFSVLSAGLFPDGAPPRLGSINCYGLHQHRVGQDATQKDTMLLLAAHAATALSSQQAFDAADREITGLRKALQTRDVIGQAKGILMGQRGIDAGEAFDTLRRASQDLNMKLAEMAETLTRYPKRNL